MRLAKMLLLRLLLEGSGYDPSIHISLSYAAIIARQQVKRLNEATSTLFCLISADHTATQYDQLLASSCRPSVCLSVCNAVHCGSQGCCTI